MLLATSIEQTATRKEAELNCYLGKTYQLKFVGWELLYWSDTWENKMANKLLIQSHQK